ncbi:MAG: hypothetical protein K8T25_02515 [Planctomycetia bacterium]|nr:hypothetical protein [Planctomycetia bacterium]
MRDDTSWSLGLGRWLGVPVRLHVSFILLGMAILFLCSPPGGPAVSEELLRQQLFEGVLVLGIWFFSVVLHEAGHIAAISRLGGLADEVILTPLGALPPRDFQFETQRELVSALAGPIVNLAVWLLCAAFLLALGEPGTSNLLNPFYPRDLLLGAWAIKALKVGMWINWLLVTVNLLPAFPLDGGRALSCMLGPAMGHRRGTMVVVKATLITAVMLLLFAVLLGPAPKGFVVAAWLPLTTIAVYLYFHAREQAQIASDDESEEDFLGYDFSQGYTSLEQRGEPAAPPRLGPIRRWLERRRQEKEARRQIIEREEELRVDAILQQLHDGGPESLSPEDRAVLHRVSARYRSRSESESS